MHIWILSWFLVFLSYVAGDLQLIPDWYCALIFFVYFTYMTLYFFPKVDSSFVIVLMVIALPFPFFMEFTSFLGFFALCVSLVIASFYFKWK